MFKYLLLVQVLLARELYSWELLHENQFRHLLRPFTNQSVNSVDNFVSFHFPQKLDNFNPTDLRKWQQEIYYNIEFYRPGGSTFVMISQGKQISGFLKKYGAWLEYAKLFGALCYLVEIRYMGDDWPTNDLSTENLKYLNSQQALADLAKLISLMPRPETTKPMKYIAFGMDHGGSLAAWLRLKYPHLVSGAVASSAPLDFGINYPDFYRTAAKLLGNYSTECVNGVRDAFKELNMALVDQNQQKQIMKLFRLCPTRYEPEVTPDDLTALNTVLADFISYKLIYVHGDTRICTIMGNETLGTPLQRLSTLFPTLSFDNCIRYKYDDLINFNSNIDWISRLPTSRLYWYEKCTEFGLFVTSDDSHVFGDRISADYYQKLCTDIFGPEHDLSALARAAASNKRSYGGLNINVTNVAFVDGSKNPFQSQCVVKDVNSKSPAIIMNGEYGGADVFAFTENDSPEVKEAKAKIVANIKSWLEE